jgi:DinB superfamily
MIRRWRLGTLLLGAVWLAAAQSGTAQTTVLAPLKTQWENTRTLVEGLVAQVPEDMYDFWPTPEVRSFREQFTHLIDENFRFMAQAAGETPPMEKSAIEQLQGRDDILKALKGSYDYGAKVWMGMTDQTAMEMIPGRGGQPQLRWAPILVQIIDNMNHYGNLVVYVRLKGMVPARTAERQQQPPPPTQR